MRFNKKLLTKINSIFSVSRKLTTISPFFKDRKRFLVERSSQQNFFQNLLGSTFRNSKWLDYSKTNVNKNRSQNLKRFVYIVLVAIFLILVIKLLVNHFMLKNFVNSTLNVQEWFSTISSLYTLTSSHVRTKVTTALSRVRQF